MKNNPLTYKRAAEILGCSTYHLWAVVKGLRTSKDLLKRYKALCSKAQKLNRELAQ